ncbi:AraC family transcriptional regulator [Rhabdobacter roseus]|uniref:AraC-like DNA-binding protein n=1 Tax=Rhabdobacter roseus TaxID=1655419 RepID=A0A840TGT9_9BACT|nr:AraC family transcriptional regulator [Rhabdobacter roseus]MBB5282441.1 AraC-like DNA-binding protein [Rhabdobacter roseus]
MKAYLEEVGLGEGRSLVVKHFRGPYFDAPYHFHPEYELTYIVQGQGQRFVGDQVEAFREGDLVLLGPNLAHCWRSDERYYQVPATHESESVVIQFSERFVQSALAGIPEFSALTPIFLSAQRGLCFRPSRNDHDAASALNQPPQSTPAEQVVLFLRLLLNLVQENTRRFLASEGYLPRPNQVETDRMQRILDYTMLHFKETISLSEIAAIAHLSEAAFCRYFRQRTRKSYVAYLNELRVGHARQLLVTTSEGVGQVALLCGFPNLSHFHRLFRRFTGYSPLRYRQLYQAPVSPSAS